MSAITEPRLFTVNTAFAPFLARFTRTSPPCGSYFIALSTSIINNLHIIVTGGTLYAASTLGMVETPLSDSAHCVVSYAQNQSIASGSVLSVKDSDGNEIMSVTILKSCQSVIMSSPGFASGKTYYVYVDSDRAASTTINGILTYIGSAESTGGSTGGNRPGGNDPETRAEIPFPEENNDHPEFFLYSCNEKNALRGERVLFVIFFLPASPPVWGAGASKPV